MKPVIINPRVKTSGEKYDIYLPKSITFNFSDYAVATAPTEFLARYLHENLEYTNLTARPLAVRENGKWQIRRYIHTQSLYYSHSDINLYVFHNFEGGHSEKLAYPIDPRMTHTDITNATYIFPNDTNDGWLFSHAHENDHHERVILLESIMHTLFEDLVHDKLLGVLKAVVGSDNPSPQIGTELLYTYNAQSGQLANYSNLIDFRKECIKWCSEVEKLLHLGQHVQEDNHYLQHQLVRAIEQAKLIWNADTGKKSILASIASEVNAIIARVETDHEIDTRWVKAAKAEAARKAAEAAANENEGDNGNGS